MAESGSSSLGFRLDIKQILSEAQHRWLRPAEIVEILRNYQKFHISPAAPNKPVSGSVFLFDRKVLRYFRKDGHNWRKKKDGKTVKEAHEKLKVGSIDMLHCYYAHGEDNENFQRRSYWLLEQDLMHIVFAHYLEVKGNKTNISSSRNSDTVVSNSENNSVLLSSSFHGTSPSSTLSSACEDAESEDNHQASSRFHSFPESPLTDGSHYVQSSSYNPISSPGQTAFKQESGCYLPVQANWQTSIQDSFEDFSLKLHIPTMNQNPILNLPPDQGNTSFEEKSLHVNQENFVRPFYTLPDEQKEQSEQKNLQMLLSEAERGHAMNQNMENLTSMGNENYSLFLKKPSISGLQKEENLKKADSFSRWIAKELEDYDELNLQSNNGISWSGYGMPAQLQVDLDTLNPSISQDQLFSIMDFSPNWAYTNMKTKVLVTGIFLKSEQELSKCRWSIMFGQVEVAAEVLADGILCCRAPLQNPGVVPFYVTCSNRLACSEIREFEYRFEQDQSMGGIDERGSTNVMHLYQRFETKLSLETSGSDLNSSGNDFGKQNIINKIFSFMEEENNQEIKLTPEKDTTELMVIGELLLQKQLKEKFYNWLFHKLSYDSESIADVKGGQGVLHLAAALGFNWALQPIIVSGISIDFRDVNGWTALHWAAHYGREDTVAALVSLGASPGALTDPSAEYPLGRTPADLASSSGHKGISGFLAETTLTTHLSTLGVDDPLEDGISGFSGSRAVQTVSERLAVPTTGEDVPDTLSLKDSLAAICNATQAAARIHQIFRTQSFHRKQLLEHGGDESVTPNEHAISLVAGKNSRLGRASGGANAAAVRIQKKFRGWKKRKEFLLIRQKVVKIQAHFRGHQVRKKYKTIIWSVGIMEKVILRWRRKRSGLRGFRSDAVAKVENVQGTLTQEDDYDFLKEGRKQTEERMQKALARVKSMAQYPEARAQYRRLLTAAEGFRETKDASDAEIQESSDDMFYPQDDLIDIESLLDDDTFMSLAFQ